MAPSLGSKTLKASSISEITGFIDPSREIWYLTLDGFPMPTLSAVEIRDYSNTLDGFLMPTLFAVEIWDYSNRRFMICG